MRVTGMRSIEQCRRVVEVAKDARQCDTAQRVESLQGGFMRRLTACIYLAGTLGQEAFLKSRNFPLFLQGAVFAALKMLGIHKGFLCFLPCIPSNLAKNRRISLFSEKPLKTAAGRFFLTRSIESAAKQETFDIRRGFYCLDVI